MRLRNGTLTVNEARARTAGSRSRAATSRSSARAWSGSATPPWARPSRRSRRRCPRRRRPARPTPRKRPTATSPPGSRRRPRTRPRPRPRRKPTGRSWRAYSGSWSVWRGPSMKRRTVLTLATATAAIAEVVLLRATKTTTAQNTYGLPIGTPITKELRKWFAEQRAMVLGTLAKLGVELPAKFPPLTDYNDPMASAMAPLISAYWDHAGKEVRERLGLDPDEWRVTDPHLKEKIDRADRDPPARTRPRASGLTRLDALRRELAEGVVERGDSLAATSKARRAGLRPGRGLAGPADRRERGEPGRPRRRGPEREGVGRRRRHQAARGRRLPALPAALQGTAAGGRGPARRRVRPDRRSPGVFEHQAPAHPSFVPMHTSTCVVSRPGSGDRAGQTVPKPSRPSQTRADAEAQAEAGPQAGPPPPPKPKPKPKPPDAWPADP